MCNWKKLVLTGMINNEVLLRHPAILLRKTDLKNWAGVYVWNPHHRAHPPAYFCVRARLTTASGHVVTILRGRTHTIDGKQLIFSYLALSLCAKVKPFGFTPMYAQVGTQASTWTPTRLLPATQFLKEIAIHTRTPSLAPSCACVRLLCTHNACVVVPECQRVALCAPTRVHALVVCAHDCVPECPFTHVLAHNAPRYTPAHPHTHEGVPMYAPKCRVAYCVRGRT